MPDRSNAPPAPAPPPPARAPAPAAIDAESVTVSRVSPAVTYRLRQQVLRPDSPLERVHLAVDDDPDTAAFAAQTPDGRVVGTAIVFPEPCPWLSGRQGAWRLRGMATDPSYRNAGVGGQVLAALLDHVAVNGGTLVWCNARVPARRFYERAGFVAHGDVWDEPEIGPHVAMWREIRREA